MSVHKPTNWIQQYSTRLSLLSLVYTYIDIAEHWKVSYKYLEISPLTTSVSTSSNKAILLFIPTAIIRPKEANNYLRPSS
jgi:hypothetical protein